MRTVAPQRAKVLQTAGTPCCEALPLRAIHGETDKPISIEGACEQLAITAPNSTLVSRSAATMASPICAVEIDEGDVTSIKRISFVGNEHFSDGTLRGKIRTTEAAWWRFLSSDDRYDPDRLNLDRELLRKFYLSEGYADFRVVSAVAVAAVVLVAADIVWARLFWHGELKMTRQEVKDELKQADGDPILKARMRSLARDRLRKRMADQRSERAWICGQCDIL